VGLSPRKSLRIEHTSERHQNARNQGIAEARQAQLWQTTHASSSGGTPPKTATRYLVTIISCSKRVWMQCPGCPTCGQVHEFSAAGCKLYRRSLDFGCPTCMPKQKAFCSCRGISANELLAAEWHEDNPDPATVNQGSTTRYKWRCADAACGHVWETKPAHRSKFGGSNCPKCAIKDQYRGMRHSSLGVGRPELLLEWDGQKNQLPAAEVSCSSGRKVWWLCKYCGHSWETTVELRALKYHGCPRCSEGG